MTQKEMNEIAYNNTMQELASLLNMTTEQVENLLNDTEQ